MVRGSCLCGGVRFEVAQVPLIVLCHCAACRKANGSAFDAGAAVPVADFKLTDGEELIQDYRSSPELNRRFCRVCGSRVPSEAVNGEVYFIPAGLFEDDPGVKPAMHIFVGSKAAWWEVTDELPQFEKWVPGYGPGDDD